MRKLIYAIYAAALAAMLVLPAVSAGAAPKPPPAGPVQFPGSKIQQFALQLPVLDAAGGTIQTVIDTGAEIPVRMVEQRANMLPASFKPANGLPYAGTAVFTYRVSSTAVAPLSSVDTYVNPVIVATRNQPTQIRYINNLSTQAINWRLWTDQTLHSAFHQAVGMPMPATNPIDSAHYGGPVLAVPHLHGGEDPAVIDGGPEAWFASDVPGPDTTTTYLQHGPAYYSMAGAAANEAIYRYPNTQEAAPLWFHDHLLGGTRLNATFAGMAGAYAIIHPGLTLPTGLLPVGLDVNGAGGMDAANEVVVPLVIQDRMFDTNGELFFPNLGINPTVHPYWIPEFVGDTIVVNGKAWPFMNVDRQRYLFYAIDGSNSRPYDMFLQDLTTGVKGPRMWVVATDGGYLDNAVEINPNATGAQTKLGMQKSLGMMPGERYEFIIDFGDPTWLSAITAAYTALGLPVPNPLNLVLRNSAPTVDGNVNSNVDGRVMQFRVSANAPVGGDKSYNPATTPQIRTGGQKIVRLADPATGNLAAGVVANETRLLELNEVAGLGGPLEVLVNNTKWSGLSTDTTTFPGGVRPDSTLVKGTNQTDFLDWGNYLTELPQEGDAEIWEIVNSTMDKHPIHLHGLQFQLLSRQAFDTKAWTAAYAAAFPGGVLIPGYGPPLDYLTGNPSGKLGGNPDPVLLGVATPPLSYEAGWKDTVIMPPGFVTRIAVRIAPQDKAIGADDLYWDYVPNALNGVYVWHCHITDHEDNEMMRPDMFMPNPSAVRSYIQGIDY